MQSNSQYVMRSTVRRWLRRNASPATLERLLDDLSNSYASDLDRKMVEKLLVEVRS